MGKFKSAWLEFQRPTDTTDAEAELDMICQEHLGELLSYALDMTQAVELLICRTCDSKTIERMNCHGGGAFSCPIGAEKLTSVLRAARSFRMPMRGGWAWDYDYAGR